MCTSMPPIVVAECALMKAVSQLDRATCRQQAETEYSLTALGDRFITWFESI